MKHCIFYVLTEGTNKVNVEKLTPPYISYNRGGLEDAEMKKMVYVAGPYRGNIKKNIENAERKSIELIRQGFDVLTPHKNTAGYEKYEDGEITDQTWLIMDLAILARCDILYVLKNSDSSRGVQKEIAFAYIHNIPIIRE